MKRRTFLTGSVVTAEALTSQPSRAHYTPCATGQALGPGNLARSTADCEQFLKHFDPTYVESVFLPLLPGKHLCERPPPTIGLNLTKESGLPAEILGIDQGKLEAQHAKAESRFFSRDWRSAGRKIAGREITRRL